MTTAQKIQVLLVDDHTIVRQGLRTLLESYPNIQVIGEARNGEEAIMSAGKLHPDVIVMDISMEKMDGIAATRLIKAQYPRIAVVGLSVNTKDYEEYAMRKFGASELLTKDSAGVELFGAIQRAVAAVQPVLILEETSKSADQPAPTDTESIKEPKS